MTVPGDKFGSYPVLPRHRAALGLFLLLLGLAFIWMTQHDVRSSQRSTERLMTAYAQSLTAIMAEAETHGRETYDRWESELSMRLLDNARWIAALDTLDTDMRPTIQRLATAHGLHRVHLFNEQGRQEMWIAAGAPVDSTRHNQIKSGPGRGMGTGGRWKGKDGESGNRPVDPLLSGERESIVIGFREGRYEVGLRFAAGVRRSGGGAIIVNAEAESLAVSLSRIEPAHLLQSLAKTPGIRYVAIQSGDSLIAAVPAEGIMGLLAPEIVTAVTSGTEPLLLPEAVFAGVRVVEVAQALGFPAGGTDLLRVGLDASLLGEIQSNISRRAWVRLFVFLATAAMTVLLALAWQRQQVLRGEMIQVRTELIAREQDAIRTEKAAAMGALASGVAHQIRNPLNTIHMVAQKLERDPALAETVQKQLSHVRSESRRIEEIVQQFLQLARPRLPQMVSLDVGQVAADVAAAMEAAFQADKISLSVTVARAMAYADREYVIEIVENLLCNAREASPMGGRVELMVEVAGDEVEIRVDDNGPGVALELQERIFDLYFTTRPSGSGIGLGEVARMVAAMSGTVRVENTPLGGARFQVRIPVKATRHETE
jgi:signal transduction histidine kinase